MKLQQIGLLVITSIMAASCSSPPVKPIPAARPIEVPVPVIKPKPRPKPYQAKVDRYSDNVAVPAIEVDAKTAIREREEADRKIDAESDRLDPYLSKTKKVSDDEPLASRASDAKPETETSTAVMTLMLRAKVDMLAGRGHAAIGKLERGLRIQPNNPDLWNKLAEAHFQIEDYKQTESMAKKSINLASRSNTGLIRNNWRLIAKARKEMGDMDGMKAAMRAENL